MPPPQGSCVQRSRSPSDTTSTCPSSTRHPDRAPSIVPITLPRSSTVTRSYPRSVMTVRTRARAGPSAPGAVRSRMRAWASATTSCAGAAMALLGRKGLTGGPDHDDRLPHVHASTLRHKQFPHDPRHRRHQLHVRLGRVDEHERTVLLHGVAFMDEPRDDVGVGHPHPELREAHHVHPSAPFPAGMWASIGCRAARTTPAADGRMADSNGGLNGTGTVGRAQRMIGARRSPNPSPATRAATSAAKPQNELLSSATTSRPVRATDARTV